MSLDAKNIWCSSRETGTCRSDWRVRFRLARAVHVTRADKDQKSDRQVHSYRVPSRYEQVGRYLWMHNLTITSPLTRNAQNKLAECVGFDCLRGFHFVGKSFPNASRGAPFSS